MSSPGKPKSAAKGKAKKTEEENEGEDDVKDDSAKMEQNAEKSGCGTKRKAATKSGTTPAKTKKVKGKEIVTL